MFKEAAVALSLIVLPQLASAQCAKDLLSAEEAERVGWSMNFGISKDVIDVLNSMRGNSDIHGAANKINCILVDAEMPRSIQYTFLSSAVGKINLSNARSYHAGALATSLAIYGSSMMNIGRRHDADTVSILVFQEQPNILKEYLSEIRKRGVDDYTEANLPVVARTRKLDNYKEDVTRADKRVSDLLRGANKSSPNLGVVLSAIEKDEERALRFLNNEKLTEISVFIGDSQEAEQNLRVVDGAPKNVISFKDYSRYAWAISKFEDRSVFASEKFLIECRFPPESFVSYGKQTEDWKVSFVAYSNRHLILDCSEK